MRNTYCIAFSALCAVGFSFLILKQMGFFEMTIAIEEKANTTEDDIDSQDTTDSQEIHDSHESQESSIHESDYKEILSNPKEFVSHIKRVIFEDALSSDNTLFMSIKLEMISSNLPNLSKEVIDQVIEFFEKEYPTIIDFDWKNVQIEQKKLNNNCDSDKIGNFSKEKNPNEFNIDRRNLNQLFTRFYDELNTSLQKAHADPNRYYPTVRIQSLNQLRFFPVWNGLRKCILVANTPFSKKDGFKTVERIVLELETV